MADVDTHLEGGGRMGSQIIGKAPHQRETLTGRIVPLLSSRSLDELLSYRRTYMFTVTCSPLTSHRMAGCGMVCMERDISLVS